MVMKTLNEEIYRIKKIMGLTEDASVGSDGQLNIAPNLFDEFPEDILETLNNNYFYMFSTNFNWNEKSRELGQNFNKWREQHEQTEFVKNLDKIIGAVRSDLILFKRKKLAEKKLEAFEELIKPVFGKHINGNVLSKFEEEAILDPYATVESIERAFREAKNIIDQHGNIDSSKMEKSTIFTGDDINIANFERFVQQNPEYKKTFDMWNKLNDEHMDLMLKNTNAHRIIGYEDLRKLYNFLMDYRKTKR